MRNYKLIYDKPAEVWNDAIPVGNGRLGAMVYGQTGIDRMRRVRFEPVAASETAEAMEQLVFAYMDAKIWQSLKK